MRPIHKTAKYTVQPDKLDECLAAINDFIDYIKANEPGTLQYTSYQQTEDPNSFVHFMSFEDDAAEQAHGSSEGVATFTGALYPRLVGEVEFTEYRVVTST